VHGPALRHDNTLAFRREMKRRTPEAVLSDEHVRNCQVLADRHVLLDHLPKGGVAAEIGVAFGAYTDAILDRNAPQELHLVDLWESDRFRDGLDSIRSRHATLIATGALRVHRGKSVDVIPMFPNTYFDWIYIDTDHAYETTLAELHAAVPKMKPDGIIAGHDFCPGNVIAPWPYGVVEACGRFCVEAGWQFRYLVMDPRGRLSFALVRC
jgi:Methyltransferase domain